MFGRPTSPRTAVQRLGGLLRRAAARLDPPRRTAAATLPTGSRPASGPGHCLVCRRPGVRTRDLRFIRDPSRRKTVHVCSRCGFVAIDEIDPDRYRAATSLDDIPHPSGPRVGTAERPGREYQMAVLALAVLRRRKPDVLVFGAGSSLDNQHIQRLPRVGEVAIADIMKVRDDAPFVDPADPGGRRFPIVVSSEVIEHFRDPVNDFAALFRLVSEQGILICGTSVSNGRGRLANQLYVFYPDHTSFYSPEALRLLARQHGFHVDFRVPRGLGPRKRYVIFSRSPEVMSRVAAYFGAHQYAPSEVDLTDEADPE